MGTLVRGGWWHGAQEPGAGVRFVGVHGGSGGARGRRGVAAGNDVRRGFEAPATGEAVQSGNFAGILLDYVIALETAERCHGSVPNLAAGRSGKDTRPPAG